MKSDKNLAEKVYRSIIGADGKIKEMFLPVISELKINPEELREL